MIKRKIVVVALIVVVLSTMALMTACNRDPIVFDNPMVYYEMKPETFTIIANEMGEVIGFRLKDKDDMPARTVNYTIPTNDEDLKELAYTLYSIGNNTMVTVPYASYYEVGTNNSNIGGTELPLIFNTVDMRNNLTGEHFRQTLQTVKDGAELGGLAVIMQGFSEAGQRWYVKAGQFDNEYYRTAKLVKTDNGREFDWSKATVNNSVSGFEEKRLNISVHPIPYTASGYKGKIDGRNETEENVNGMKWVYDSETGYSVPTYIDGGGRLIGYEKTDQHVFYSTGDDANKYDENGVLAIEDYYNTIKSASVVYNEEGEYYTVRMELDSTKEYTHIDTEWALQDNKGANDKTAKFTKLIIEFELWDNGYFKKWQMWEDWVAPKAMLPMEAEQHYEAVFSYNVFATNYTQYYVPA